MNILVNIKQIGKKKDKITKMPFYLGNDPKTVRELITESVRTCVREYNENLKRGEDARPLSQEEIDDMSCVGKIAFGINYGGKAADENKAVEDALLAYEDGLYRIFIEGSEAGLLDSPVIIMENCEVTFIRLVMLAGRMW